MIHPQTIAIDNAEQFLLILALYNNLQILLSAVAVIFAIERLQTNYA